MAESESLPGQLHPQKDGGNLPEPQVNQEKLIAATASLTTYLTSGKDGNRAGAWNWIQGRAAGALMDVLEAEGKKESSEYRRAQTENQDLKDNRFAVANGADEYADHFNAAWWKTIRPYFKRPENDPEASPQITFMEAVEPPPPTGNETLDNARHTLAAAQAMRQAAHTALVDLNYFNPSDTF